MKPYFEDGQVTLYHGDCRDILPTIEPTDVALVLTDPPYGVNVRTDRHSAGRGRARPRPGAGAASANDFPPVYGDDAPFDPAPLLRFKRVVLFGGNHYADRLPPSASWLVWDKVDGLTSKRGVGFNDNADGELAWTSLGGPVRIYAHRWMGLVKDSERRERRLHPTQKPVSLMAQIIGQHTKPGDLVLDPYAGSGPVVRACRDLGRRCIAVEIVEAYCRVIVQRLAQLPLPLDHAS